MKLFKSKKCSYKKQYTEKEKTILRNIGYFYLLKDGYMDNEGAEAYDALYSLRIHDIKYEKKLFKPAVVKITLERPGLLIGKAGENINALQKYLAENLKEDIRIDMIESDLYMNLCSFYVMFKY